MARAFLLIRLTLVLTGALAAAGFASAGPPAGSASRSGNTFNMITAASTAPRVSTPSAGASLAPKAVVRNPYNVPLLQNASSLRSGR